MKAKPTPGPYGLTSRGAIVTNPSDPSNMSTIAQFYGNAADPEVMSNIDLTLDAFNVYHETGLTPRELKDYILKLETDIAALEEKRAHDFRLYQASVSIDEKNRELKEQRDELLKLAESVYLGIQVLVEKEIRQGSHRAAIETDGLRASLCNAIVGIKNLDAQLYQETIEHDALIKARGV